MPNWEAERKERVEGLESTYEALGSQGIGQNNPTLTAWAKYAVSKEIASLLPVQDSEGFTRVLAPNFPAYVRWSDLTKEHLAEALRLSREP